MFIIICIMTANNQDGARPRILRDIDIALLRAFVAVAESGSMTSAAGRLNVTQGAVSQRIKRLEDFLQKQLFERTGQGLDTTLDGERLLAPAQQLIGLNDEVFSLMTAPEFTGVVRLGIPYDIVMPFAAPVLKSFAASHPRVHVELELTNSDSLKAALAHGDIDLTLTTETHTPKGAERLARNDLVWVAAPGGTAYRQDPVPVLSVNENCMFRMPMLRALDGAGRAWRVNTTRNMDATYAVVSADLAITALLESTVPEFLYIIGEADGMPPLPEFFINLYTSASGANEIAAELAQHIRDQFRQWRRPYAQMAIQKNA